MKLTMWYNENELSEALFLATKMNKDHPKMIIELLHKND